MFILISTLWFCSQFFGLKAQLDVTLLDFVFESYDPDYFKDMEIITWNNDIDINMTVIDYMPLEAELRIQIIGATMGEYKVPTGIDWKFSLCEGLNEPIIMRMMMSYLVPPIDDCPPELGTYSGSYKFDDFRTFPDSFPPNNYLTITSIYTSEKTLLEMRSYVSTR
ncbi:uncharacterized protein [Chelonus insularis]|uniref:uncharacterized protein n=1 Tax=Chelonus insularis TaxID=460826 RepID=UPI00158906E4|nr:uncharacterized protein LOC118071352 [Chelonus insularis]